MESIFDKLDAYANTFIPEAQAILGQVLFTPYGEKEDTQNGTDLMCRESTVALRSRSYADGHKYPDDFTIRYSMPSGRPTEFQKILCGNYAEIYMYIIPDKTEQHIESWFVGYVGYLRTYMQTEIKRLGEQRFLEGRPYYHYGRLHTAWKTGCKFITLKKYEVPNFIFEDSSEWKRNGLLWVKPQDEHGRVTTQLSLYD